MSAAADLRKGIDRPTQQHAPKSPPPVTRPSRRYERTPSYASLYNRLDDIASDIQELQDTLEQIATVMEEREDSIGNDRDACLAIEAILEAHRERVGGGRE